VIPICGGQRKNTAIPFLPACQVNNGRESVPEVSHPTGTNVELPNASMHGVLLSFACPKEGAVLFPEEPPPSTTFCSATLHRVAINAMVRISNANSSATCVRQSRFLSHQRDISPVGGERAPTFEEVWLGVECKNTGYKMLSDIPDLHTHAGRHVLAGCLAFVPAEFNLMSRLEGRQLFEKQEEERQLLAREAIERAHNEGLRQKGIQQTPHSQRGV
jgi:hypothetical protein